MLRRIFSALNRPLPAWLTLSLILGAGAAASVPVFHGSVYVPAGATITDANAAANDCVSTNSSLHFAYGVCSGAQTNTANTFSATQTFNDVIKQQVNGVGGAVDNDIEIKNVAASKTANAQALGTVGVFAANINSGCASGEPLAQIWPGISGASSGDYGGYWVFWTKNDGACTGNEVLVLTPGGHIFPAGPGINTGSSTSGCSGSDTQGVCQITTAGSCSLGTPCGTVSVTFGNAFLQSDGVTHEQPYCQYAIQDTNTSTDLWTVQPQTIAYDHFVAQYASLATYTSKTLNIYWLCNASSY